jgi:hypothetical protein
MYMESGQAMERIESRSNLFIQTGAPPHSNLFVV